MIFLPFQFIKKLILSKFIMNYKINYILTKRDFKQFLTILILQLIVFYVDVTTNSLPNDFMKVVQIFTGFVFSFNIIAVFILSLLVLFMSNKDRKFYFLYGFATLASGVVLYLIGISGICFVEQEVERIDIYSTLYKSTLCPSYSKASYYWLSLQQLGGIVLSTTAMFGLILSKIWVALKNRNT